jgi:hypothetical protein
VRCLDSKQGGYRQYYGQAETEMLAPIAVEDGGDAVDMRQLVGNTENFADSG